MSTRPGVLPWLGLLAACGSGPSPAIPQPAPADVAPPADAGAPVTAAPDPEPCDERYDATIAAPAPAALASTVDGWVAAARRDDQVGVAAAVDPHRAELVWATLDARPVDPAQQHGPSLAALLSAETCALTWFEVPDRILIQPPFDDTPAAQAAAAEAAIDELARATHLVATCGGCGRFALAITAADGAPRAIAWGWLPPPDGPH